MSSLLLLSFPLLPFLAYSLNRGSAKRIESDRLVKSDQESGVVEGKASLSRREPKEAQQEEQVAASSSKLDSSRGTSSSKSSNSYIINKSSVLVALAAALLFVAVAFTALVAAVGAAVVATTIIIIIEIFYLIIIDQQENIHTTVYKQRSEETLAKGRSYPVTYDDCQLLGLLERHHHHPTTIYVNLDPVNKSGTLQPGYLSRPTLFDPVHNCLSLSTRLGFYYNYFLYF